MLKLADLRKPADFHLFGSLISHLAPIRHDATDLDGLGLVSSTRAGSGPRDKASGPAEDKSRRPHAVPAPKIFEIQAFNLAMAVPEPIIAAGAHAHARHKLALPFAGAVVRIASYGSSNRSRDYLQGKSSQKSAPTGRRFRSLLRALHSSFNLRCNLLCGAAVVCSRLGLCPV